MCRTRNRYLLCQTTMSPLEPLAMLQIKHQSRPAHRSKLKGTSSALVGAPGACQKRPLTAIWRGQDTGLHPSVMPHENRDKQRAGRGPGPDCQGPPGSLRKQLWTAICWAEIPARAITCCQTDIEGLGAGHWRGPRDVPKKLPCISIWGV